MAIYKCFLCEKEFKRQPADLGNPDRPFCSRSCSTTYNNSTNPRRQLQGKCAVCFTPIKNQLKFCSPECRSSLNKQKIGYRRVPNPVITAWKQDRKRRLVEYKGGQCVKCGYRGSLRALHFHHRDSNEKDFNISKMSWSFDRLMKEVDKCDLLCANCHFEHHDPLFIKPRSEDSHSERPG